MKLIMIILCQYLLFPNIALFVSINAIYIGIEINQVDGKDTERE